MVPLSSFLLVALASAKCFEPTIAHPPPRYNAGDPLLQDAFESIDTALIAAVAAPEFDRTSFSVEITSSKDTLWSHHHTARERNASRPDIPEVNGDALYRIASITKTFTVLGILYQHAAGNLSLDATVNTYLKELGDKSNGGIPWKDITLRSLASQLSGLPRECKMSSGKKQNLFAVCHTDEDMFRQLKKFAPLFAPNQESSYSNVAFELLGLVLSRVANQTYETYIDEAIFKPLNMSTSTLSKPADSAGVIPAGPQFWGVDEGIQNPTGGIYSSSNDLSKYLRYILTHYNAITHAVNWLHPVSSSRGLNSFYGMPWEIYQTDRILEQSKRTVRFVTKSGGLPGYTSIIITVPEYDLGITILVAGPNAILSKIMDIVTVKIVHAAEKLAIQQMRNRYAGTYSASDPEVNSTATLRADYRGLVVTTFVSNGTVVFEAPITKDATSPPRYAQLSPTLLYRNEEEQDGEEWRALIVEERAEGLGSIWDDFCVEDWEMSSYAGIPLNTAVFWDEQKDGHFETLELPAFRVNLTRVDQKRGSNGKYGQQETMEL
ncbi:uncharacterized protein J4E88_002554 [Alternaria novae-zelandiae]|uniref:uncharacterized protein n=1 Tax=Alternaria novae-zelandiae TaxID=430562 RepID=UPI0020C5745F|nr:uncharacterized protein J4E88_002554 [Alternaria novae-zelandiae]KAI4689205.1 hypothetical protein J4E88_002554 [Alternaria novae-zelandiae]